VKGVPGVANGVIDCNHWYNAKDKRATTLRRKVEGIKDQFFTYEVFLNYQCVYLLADAIERARSRDRAAIVEALAGSTWDKHFMPYGPTKFVNGQNTGARPLVMQVLKGDIVVVLPKEYRQADPVFPWKA
jgi:branched-chain amino acid transport system substrate-binding protein